MARPIKETPILHGEDARVFEARMKNPPKESREKMEEINRDYNYIMTTLCLFHCCQCFCVWDIFQGSTP